MTFVGTVVRDATADDTEAVLRMVADLAAELEDPPPRLTAAAFACDVVGAERRVHALVAEQDGRPVGYAVLHPGYNTVLGGPVTHLVDLFVVPSARRQGIGRARHRTGLTVMSLDEGGLSTLAGAESRPAGDRAGAS